MPYRAGSIWCCTALGSWAGHGATALCKRYGRSKIQPFSEVQIPEAAVRKDELKLAVQLAGQPRSDEFHPEKYKDEV
jgi:hypothetical protein